MFKRILVASDLSDACCPALRMALHLGCDLGASVVALHVIEERPDEADEHNPAPIGGVHAIAAAHRGEPMTRREEQATRMRLERQTRRQVPCGHSPATEAIVRAGPVVETIIAMAEAGEADLVVIGSGRRPGRLGSIAAEVVRQVGRPVLAVPPEKDEHESAQDREVHDPGSAHHRVKPDAVGSP